MAVMAHISLSVSSIHKHRTPAKQCSGERWSKHSTNFSSVALRFVWPLSISFSMFFHLLGEIEMVRARKLFVGLMTSCGHAEHQNEILYQ